jgi:hypothetical protein
MRWGDPAAPLGVCEFVPSYGPTYRVVCARLSACLRFFIYVLGCVFLCMCVLAYRCVRVYMCVCGVRCIGQWMCACTPPSCVWGAGMSASAHAGAASSSRVTHRDRLGVAVQVAALQATPIINAHSRRLAVHRTGEGDISARGEAAAAEREARLLKLRGDMDAAAVKEVTAAPVINEVCACGRGGAVAVFLARCAALWRRRARACVCVCVRVFFCACVCVLSRAGSWSGAWGTC